FDRRRHTHSALRPRHRHVSCWPPGPRLLGGGLHPPGFAPRPDPGPDFRPGHLRLPPTRHAPRPLAGARRLPHVRSEIPLASSWPSTTTRIWRELFITSTRWYGSRG